MKKKDSEQFYNELKDTFMAIPDEETKNMTMTQEDTIAEAEMYVVTAGEDFDKLTHEGHSGSGYLLFERVAHLRTIQDSLPLFTGHRLDGQPIALAQNIHADQDGVLAQKVAG